MAERLKDTDHEVEQSTDVRSLFPEGEMGDQLYEHARSLRSDDEISSLRRDFNTGDDYYGAMQFLSIATGVGCDFITAQIDEKTQRCGGQGMTTVDFYLPNDDRDFLVACDEEHAQRIMIGVALDSAELIESGEPRIGRNGFTLEEYHKKMREREETSQG